jgi:hypothetical protein
MWKMNWIRIPSIFVALLAFQGCAMAGKCSPVAEEFIHKPMAEQLAKFRDRKLEEQYEIYICGTQVVHPPLLHLAQRFARDGETAVGFLRSRLEQAHDDATIRDITMVFVEMSRQGTYPVGGDAALMKTINESTARIKDKGWRTYTTNQVNSIVAAH